MRLSRVLDGNNGTKRDSVKVSVVIPCYNQGRFLKRAVESVRRSNYKNYEIIITDDGSNDHSTIKVFKAFEEKFKNNERVTILHQRNLGLAAARNTAISAAKGEYILPLDSDNLIRPSYLSKAVRILDRYDEVGVVYAYAKTFGEDDPYQDLFGGVKGVRKFQDFDPKRLLVNNFIDACSVMRKKVWEDCNGYDGNMGVMGYEDWDLWISAMEKGWGFYLIKEVLFEYYIHKNSMIAACNIPENRRKIIRYICEKHRESYIQNIEYVIAEKDVRILLAENRLLSCKEVSKKSLAVAEAFRILRGEGLMALITQIIRKGSEFFKMMV